MDEARTISSLSPRAELPPVRPPAVPDYALLERIGGGAYGEVWLARSEATGVPRAAKIVWRHRFEDARPFQREFEGIQKFERSSREHPSQLALFHIGRNEEQGYFYYVMELADGMGAEGATRGAQSMARNGTNRAAASEVSPESYVPHTLRADLGCGRLPAARVLELGLALTEALGHLHRHGLVHRDVKPSNVIFVNGRPKLADIGLVTDVSDQCSIVGTEGYLPPEGPGTPQADIFALGKVLYEAVTGMDRRQFPDLPEDLRSWPDARLALELNQIVLAACATGARARYASAEEMLNDLQRLQAGQSIMRRRAAQRWWAVSRKVGIAISVVAALGVLISVWVHQASRRSGSSDDGPDSPIPEANVYCDKAINILRDDNSGQFVTAYQDLNKAISLDTHFARPWVYLLDLRARVSVPGIPPATTEVLRDIRQHLKLLAPDLAATHVAEGIVNYSELHFPEAERSLLRAIAADPKYELAHTWYGWLLCCFGRPEEAYEQVMISQKLARSKAVIYRTFGNIRYAERKYPEAIAWYLKTLEFETNHIQAYMSIGRCLQAMGKYAESLPYREKGDILSGADEAAMKQRLESLRRALDLNGPSGFWSQRWTQVEGNTNAGFYAKAVIRMHLNDTNAALDLLEASYSRTERARGYITPVTRLLYDDCWEGLHDNPRFRKLLDEIGYTKVMRPEPKQ